MGNNHRDDGASVSWWGEVKQSFPGYRERDEGGF